MITQFGPQCKHPVYPIQSKCQTVPQTHNHNVKSHLTISDLRNQCEFAYNSFMNNEYFQQLLQSIQDSDPSHEFTFNKKLISFGDPNQPFTSTNVADNYLSEDLLSIIVLAYSKGYFNKIQQLNSTIFELQPNVWFGLNDTNYSIIYETPVIKVTL